MSEWISINLPWFALADDHEYIPIPDLSKEEKNRFGKTLQECEAELDKVLGEDSFDFMCSVDDEVEELVDPTCNYLDHIAALEKLAEEKYIDEGLDDPMKYNKMKTLASYRRFKQEREDWFWAQPEAIEWNRNLDELDKTRGERAKLLSFSGAGLNKPGTLIEVEMDGDLKQFLIGDINCLGGVCDDCKMFGSDTIVLRYKVLI